MNWNEWNAKIIEEFRANGGKVGGDFEGAPLLLLHTKGAKTGRPHVTPLMYLAEDGRTFVFASKGGAATNPDWYHNLVADPDVTIEIGVGTSQARAEVVTGAERDELYARQVERRPQFGEYERRTARTIPVVRLERVA
jgi:deazaflavin-dependent oxidoreductase (nitroreductase family)